VTGPLRTAAAALALLVATAIAGCELSPAEPTDLDRQPVLEVSEGRAFRFGTGVLYSFSGGISNSPIGATITVQQTDITLLGPSGETYATVAGSIRNSRLSPGGGISGSLGSYQDSNVSRPFATSYRVRMTFTREDGSTGSLEGSSTIRAS
jgi:hypothetical protein